MIASRDNNSILPNRLDFKSCGNAVYDTLFSCIDECSMSYETLSRQLHATSMTQCSLIDENDATISLNDVDKAMDELAVFCHDPCFYETVIQLECEVSFLYSLHGL
jgi:hypothetical protein